MVYSDLQILDAQQRGHIVIYPFIAEYVRGSSVDVTLGEFYYELDAQTRNGYNPFDQADVERYFGEPHEAIAAIDWSAQNKNQTWRNIPPDHPIIVLRPGQRILAHTHEFIGINPPGTTEMRARSSWGRNGVVVCKDAGWGDPGFINRWTMEIQNDNPEPVVLPVGERVAQLIFHQTGKVGGHYGESGKYQGGKSLPEIVSSWSPQQMLPRAYKDERRLPISVSSVDATEMVATTDQFVRDEEARKDAAVPPPWRDDA